MRTEIRNSIGAAKNGTLPGGNWQELKNRERIAIQRLGRNLKDNQVSHLLAGIVFCALLILGIVSYTVLASSRSTERLVSEFREQDERLDSLQALVDIIPGGVATICAEKGVIRYVNQGFEEISGYSERELLGQSMLVLIPEKHRQQHVERMKDPSAWWRDSGTVRTCIPKAEIATKNGTTVECSLTISPVRVGDRKEWQVFIDPTTLRLSSEAKNQ